MTMAESGSDKGIRLNRFLAQCGVASRRKCESYITDGRIMVNGKVCTNLATRIHPGDTVHADGHQLKTKEAITILLFKPSGVDRRRWKRGSTTALPFTVCCQDSWPKPVARKGTVRGTQGTRSIVNVIRKTIETIGPERSAWRKVRPVTLAVRSSF